MEERIPSTREVSFTARHGGVVDLGKVDVSTVAECVTWNVLIRSNRG